MSLLVPPSDLELPGALTLSVPARPEAVRVVRSVMRSWAADARFLFDEIDDLCLAVDEAFASLLAMEPGPTRVTVRVRAERDGVDITAACDTSEVPWPPDRLQSSLSWRVLTTLIDDVRFETAPEGPAIRMIKRRARR